MSRRPSADLSRAVTRQTPPTPRLQPAPPVGACGDGPGTNALASLNRVGDGAYINAYAVQSKGAPIARLNEPGRGQDHSRVQRSR